MPVVDEQRRQSALRVDRGNGSWSGRTAEVGRGVLEHDLHDHGVGRCDLRGYFQGQRRVFERHRHGVVRDGLERNLDALRDLGFHVVQRGDTRRGQDAPVPRGLERSEGDVEIERPVDRTERKTNGAGRLADAEVHSGRLASRALRRPDAPVEAPAVGERQICRVAERRIDATIESPLNAKLPRIILVRLDDAGLDLDLGLCPVERDQQVGDGIEPLLQVGHDERVGAGIDLHGASLRERALGQESLQFFGFGIAQRPGEDAKLSSQGLLVRQLPPLTLFVGQNGERRDAHDRTVNDVAELVGAQNDVERLVPGDVAQGDIDRALDGRIDHHVQTADLGKHTQHRAKVGLLKVEAHWIAGVGPSVARGRLSLHSLPGQRLCRLRRGLCSLRGQGQELGWRDPACLRCCAYRGRCLRG